MRSFLVHIFKKQSDKGFTPSEVVGNLLPNSSYVPDGGAYNKGAIKPRQLPTGFTLVEMVVYAAILGVITVLAVNGTLTMVQAYTNLRVSRDLNAGATAVLERLTREIRGADSVATAATNQLILNTVDSGGTATTVELYRDLSDNLMKVREGGVSQGALTPSSTRVDGFVPQALSGTNSSAVKVDLTMSATRGTISKTRTFHTTVVMRGSY